MIKFAGQVVPLKINADKQPAVLQKYGVTGLPTLMFLDANGKPFGQFLGFREPKDFVAEGNRILKSRKKK